MTSIEWVKNPDGTQGITWNPLTGCLNHVNGLCKGGGFPCYAYKLANTRLKQRYLANENLPLHALPYSSYRADPFYPRFWEERLYNFRIIPYRDMQPKSRGIFVCDMGDLFGIGVPEEWTNQVLAECKESPHNRFYLLTKQPQNLIKFSPFPENCWVGVTATTAQQFGNALQYLPDVNAKIKFVSFEPLLERICVTERLDDFQWLIIGACTGTKAEMTRLARNHSPFLTEMPYGNRWTAQPNPEWVREIVEAADKAGIPVFLKDNLKPLLTHIDLAPFIEYPWAYRDMRLRQELPK